MVFGYEFSELEITETGTVERAFRNEELGEGVIESLPEPKEGFGRDANGRTIYKARLRLLDLTCTPSEDISYVGAEPIRCLTHDKTTVQIIRIGLKKSLGVE